MSNTAYVEVYKDSSGEYRWRRMASSDIVAVSGEGYINLEHAIKRAVLEAEAHGVELRTLTA